MDGVQDAVLKCLNTLTSHSIHHNSGLDNLPNPKSTQFSMLVSAVALEQHQQGPYLPIPDSFGLVDLLERCLPGLTE